MSRWRASDRVPSFWASLAAEPRSSVLVRQKGYGAVLRHKIVQLFSGGPLERVARRAYSTYRNSIPAAILPADQVKARQYDRLTLEIVRRVLSGGGNGIDIGAHDGGILRAFTKISPTGSHWAFEPIPNLAKQLQRHFPGVAVRQLALSDRAGIADFHFLPQAAGYSSLLERADIEAGQEVRLLQVEVRQLDECIPSEVPIAFIKIDVEGAEAAVLRGASRILQEYQPVVVFECSSAKLTDCVPPLLGAGLQISFLADYMAGQRRELDDVLSMGKRRGEYYYVASPDRDASVKARGYPG